MPVYMIRAGEHGPVKIGWSANLTTRLASLQAANAEELRIIRKLDMGHGVEQWFHRHFADCCIRGEWFRFAPEMLTIEPGDYADLAFLGREFWKRRDALIGLLNDRTDLTYQEIAAQLGIPSTIIGNWVGALQMRGYAPHRNRRTTQRAAA